MKTTGIDGSKLGWLAIDVIWGEKRAKFWGLRNVKTFEEAVTCEATSVAVDIPVGLLDEPQAGGRDCDMAARALLGRPRASGVFSPPARSILHAASFDEVRGHCMTIQGFHIMAKIREVDAWMTPERQQRVFEAHPEVAFMAMTGAPIAEPKRRTAGKQRRMAALDAYFPGIAEWVDSNRPPAKEAGLDDVLDAFVIAWTAWRKQRGEANCLPVKLPRDAKGLDMAIWS